MYYCFDNLITQIKTNTPLPIFVESVIHYHCEQLLHTRLLRPSRMAACAEFIIRPRDYHDLNRLTHLIQFFAATIPAAPTAYAPRRLLQLTSPICL